MNRIILALALLATGTAAFAQVHVRGYTRRDGTYVAPHYRSAPNATTRDNYSTRGNVNPYTGQVGTRDPDSGYHARPAPSLYGQSDDDQSDASGPND